MKLGIQAIIVLGGIGALGLYVWKKGGVTAAASSAGAAVVNATGAAASGAVGAVGASVGLPTPTETVTDPAVARWIIDHAGYWEASKWCGVPALVQGAAMDAGTGVPPPAASAAGRRFAPSAPSTGDFARMDRGGYADPAWGEIDFGNGGGW